MWRAPCARSAPGLFVSVLPLLRCSNKFDDPMDDPDDGASEKSVSQRLLSASARARKALARMIHTDMEDGGAASRTAGKQTAENGQSLADRAARVKARDDARADASEGASKGPAAAATKSSKSVQQLPRARVGSSSDGIGMEGAPAEDGMIAVDEDGSDGGFWPVRW